jgi:hypothetical protein
MLRRERFFIPCLVFAMCVLHPSCDSKSALRGLEVLDSETRDSTLVSFGRASGALQVVSPDEKHPEVFHALERAVEGHQGRLERWALDLTGLRVEGFRFTFAARRQADGILVVRYYAPTIVRDQIYAGVQVQFLVSTVARELIEVLFDRVPYEL